MSTDKEDLALEEDFVAEDADDSEDPEDPPQEVTKSNLTTRRTIDNYLDELRLQKQLSDYDFDL